jgi:hypothetical protein
MDMHGVRFDERGAPDQGCGNCVRLAIVEQALGHGAMIWLVRMEPIARKAHVDVLAEAFAYGVDRNGRRPGKLVPDANDLSHWF